MINQAEKDRFSEICLDITNKIHSRDSIGTYKEKLLHLVLKKFFCDDESCHEIKQGQYVADAATDREIFEIQTGGLYPLKKKISAYLADTDKKINLVFPIITRKRLFWVDAESGDMGEPREFTVARPKNKLLRELMRIADVLDFSRVSLKMVLLSVDEYKLLDGKGADKKIKATKIDRIPCEIFDVVSIDSNKAAAEFFLPSSLPSEFRLKDFEKATGLKRKGVSAGIRSLMMLDVIEREKQGERKVVYRKKER